MTEHVPATAEGLPQISRLERPAPVAVPFLNEMDYRHMEAGLAALRAFVTPDRIGVDIIEHRQFRAGPDGCHDVHVGTRLSFKIVRRVL